MTTIINRKIGIHRGRRRIYLDGRKLGRQGLRPGQRYNVVSKDEALCLEIAEQGKYTVSRRTVGGDLVPVIDCCAAEIAELFEGVEMVRVAVKAKTIVITAHQHSTNAAARERRLATKLALGRPLDICSLFHGGGVMDKSLHAGLKRAHIKSRVAVAVELESQYLESSLRNNPELWDDRSQVFESPVQDVDLLDIDREVDVLVAGIPCTGASKSGRAKNKLQFAESHSAAGAMFFSFLQFAQSLNPSIIIIENVTPYAFTASMEVIRSVLDSLGYRLQERVLEGNAFGALEVRKRLAVVAVSKGIPIGSVEDIMPVREKEARLSDVLEPIALDDERWKPFTYLAEKEARDVAAGKNFTRRLLTGEESFCGTSGRGYSKARSTEPFIRHPTNPALSRLFTKTENAAVKTVPPEVVNGLSDTVAHQVLGQGVIFAAFEALGLWLGTQLRFWARAAVSRRRESAGAYAA
ncbi:DNA cytosine methyltransferase [Marinimicrobium sp. ABcell2]|uniref:DNA cytosine methyltransferase n=1 Tax=Marinimicrobium sp. ABcell2 TaxID=3069751 RepID=UPI0027B85977|nr:DNA cytosine methyltransferase [Marinimicrobium sp. ABcell2]MDQ2077438.1 DNA cytosine methyltransferase [Marinimicrobium sp. ABcell2]